MRAWRAPPRQAWASTPAGIAPGLDAKIVAIRIGESALRYWSLAGAWRLPAAHLPGFSGQREEMLVITRAAAVVATAVGTVLTIAACGGSPRPAPGYLAVNGSHVDFIHWEPTSGSNVRGTLTVASVSGTVPHERVSTSTHPFVGTIHGNSVTLTFSSVLTKGRIHGTLKGGALTLQVPQAKDAIQPGSLMQSDTTDYNAAVAGLNRGIQHANSFAEKARGQAYKRQRHASPEKSARIDLATLQQDASLASSGNLGSDLSSFASDIQRADSDLATEEQDAAGGNSYCRLTDTITGNEKSVRGDFRSVQGDVKALTPDLASVRRDIATVEGDMRTLSVKRLPAPSGADPQAAIATAGANISQAITQANGYIDHMNADYAQAYSFAYGQAESSCHKHGPGLQASPIPHIG